MGSSSQKWTRGTLLGRGSTATVSLAITATSNTFAVKSTDLRTSEPLQREQRLLSSIPSSPHLITYLGFDITPTTFNLFLEYAPGGSLSDHISGKGLDEESEIRYYTRGILMGLSHLHSLGFAHCDIKPRNVLLAADGSAKLADFGCARRLSDKDHLVLAGTPLYLSPEAARGEERGTAADVWALGCTVIEMTTGQPPWREVNDVVSAIHRIGFSGNSPEIPTWVSAETRDFVSKCLEWDPRRRLSADELLLHPFVAAVAGPHRSSPKCVLDLDMWESLELEVGEGDVEEEESMQSDPGCRIRELTEDASTAVDVGEWADVDGRWIVVRTAGIDEKPADVKVGVISPTGEMGSVALNCEDYYSRDLRINCLVVSSEVDLR